MPSTLAGDVSISSGQQLMWRSTTGYTITSAHWVLSLKRGIYIIFPISKSQGPSQKRDRENLRAGAEEDCCGILSSGHDMTVALKSSLQPWLPAQIQVNKVSKQPFQQAALIGLSWLLTQGKDRKREENTLGVPRWRDWGCIWSRSMVYMHEIVK